MSSAAKRAATRQTIAAAPADASAARAPTRPISVHLTPFAPGCASAPIHHKSRWRTFYGRTPEQAVRATLGKIRRAPGQVRARAENGDVLLLAQVPPEALRLVSGQDGEFAPFAVFWDGVSLGDVEAALADLTARRWAPAELGA